jgi:hypothetical protein
MVTALTAITPRIAFPQRLDFHSTVAGLQQLENGPRAIESCGTAPDGAGPRLLWWGTVDRWGQYASALFAYMRMRGHAQPSRDHIHSRARCYA